MPLTYSGPVADQADQVTRGHPELGPEGGSTLRAEMRDRLITLRDMDRPLRLATGLAFAVLVGAGLLVALRSIGGPSVYLGAGTSEATPILVGSLVLLAFGMGYLLTGAVLATWWVAVPLLVVVTGAAGYEVGAFGSLLAGHGVGDLLPTWARWTTRLIVVGLWVVAGYVFVRDRAHTDRRTRVVVLLLNSTLVGAYLLVIFFSVPERGGLSLGGATATQVMVDLAILVNPLLQVAAVDYGEWGQLLGQRTGRVAARYRAAIATAIALAAGAGLVVWGILKAPSIGLRYLGYPALMLAGIVVLALVIGRLLGAHHRTWHEPFNYLGLLAVSALVLLISAVVSLATPTTVFASSAKDHYGFADPSGRFLASSGASARRILQGPEQFTILVPQGMARDSRRDITAFTDYEGTRTGPPKTLDQVLFTVVPGALDVPTQLQQLGADPSQTSSYAGWTVASLVSSDRVGLAAARNYIEDGQPVTAIMEATAPAVEFHTELPVLLAFLNSFRPGSQAPASVLAEDTAVDYTPVWGRTITTSLAIGALLLIIAAVGRKRLSPRVLAPLLLFPATALLTLVLFSNYLGRYLAGARADWPSVGPSGLYFGVGLLGLAAVVGARVFNRGDPARAARSTTAVLAFEVAVFVLAAMDVLYGHAVSAGRAAVAAGLILLVALAWEVATSGRSLLNRGTAAMPRASRVLLYSGYVVVVAGAVLFFTGQRATSTGQVVEAAFEPESVTQAALFRLALPVLAVATLLGVFGRHRSGEDEPVGAAN